MESYFQNPIQIDFLKNPEKTMHIHHLASQIDSLTGNKSLTITHRQTFFFLHHCIELLNLLMLKILEITMDVHHFTKLPLLGIFNKKSQKPTKIWKLFFQKYNKTSNKISSRLSPLWQSSWAGTPSLLLAQLKIISL